MTKTDLYILGIITGGFLFYWLYHKVNRFRRSKMVKRAKKAEKEAINVLKKEGYHIESIQERATVYTEVDGKSQENIVIADYIVKKAGKRFLVEVKTGKQTERITASSIRRQLLEYFLIFRPHGIILLDMENRKLKHIFFKSNKLPISLAEKINRLFFYLIIFTIGAFSGLIYSKLK